MSSLVDYPSILLGLAVGAAGASIVSYRILKQAPAAKGAMKEVSAPKIPIEAKLIPKGELDKSRREMKTLLLEKELLAGAITRLFEAEADNKITKTEREQLVVKYREQLKSIEQKLGNVETYIEVGELEGLRDELVNLFESKIGNIENRLQDSRVRLEQLRGPLVPIESALEPEKPVERKVEKPKPKEESESDRKVRELRDEVLEALARLEQIDIE